MMCGTPLPTQIPVEPFAGRDEAIHLRVDGGGNVLSVDRHGLSFLEYLAKTLAQCLGSLANHLTTEDITVFCTTFASLSP